MKIVKIVVAVVVIDLLIAAYLLPIGPVPGFIIGGTPTTTPTAWPDTSGVHEISLGVAGTLPRVVIIWVVDHEGELHVVGSKESGWVNMLGEGGPVEMRLGENTYALTAVRVTEGFEGILASYIGKYEKDYPEMIAGFPKLEEARDSVGVFRLER